MSTPSSTATAKLYARKTIQKLSTLNTNASNESIQTISNWIIFNRKKVIDIGDGMLLYITESCSSSNNSSVSTNDSSETIGRLMLVVKIINQVLLFNCPTTTMDGDNNTSNSDSDNTDKWIKSSQLRIKLSEIVILPLWKALATSLHNTTNSNNTQTQTTLKVDQYNIEIKNIVDNWRKCNVFDSVTILDEYKRGWSRALKDAATASSTSSSTVAADVGDSVDDAEKKNEEEVKTTASSADNNEADEKVVAAAAKEENSNSKVEQAAPTSEGTNEESNSKKNDEKKDADMTDEQVEDESLMQADNEIVPVEETNSVEGSGKKEVDQQVSSSARRDSIADVEVDFEGVEEAKVEPSQFLQACKVIASIQITRDLGSDAAMNISSALSNIPSEVEEACNTILQQQKSGGGNDSSTTTSITELLSSDTLSALPDELLDMDLKYAKTQLQTYKEAIRQQRKARLQCLHLLLQSRCSFGSMDAARSFCGGDGSEVSMDDVLEKLKKRKEVLVDALALEGLDVDEDAEEKMEKMEQELKPLAWFPGQSESSEAVEEPAAKKLKSG